MNETERHLISQCLNGERERDCEWCPASPNRNGSCCFGLRHEHGDPDCTACELENECVHLTHGYAKSDVRRPSTRIVYPGRRPANSPSSTRVRVGSPRAQQAPHYYPTVADDGPHQGEALLVPRPCDPVPLQLNPKDTLFTRFLKVSSWGAGEGFFEMGLNFFRKRRPE